MPHPEAKLPKKQKSIDKQEQLSYSSNNYEDLHAESTPRRDSACHNYHIWLQNATYIFIESDA